MDFLNKYSHSKNKRFSSFKKALEIAKSRDLKTFVETGTSRGKIKFFFFFKYNWKDGMSTLIFSEYVKNYNGHLFTCDINPNNIKNSKKFVKDEEHAKKIKIGMWAMKFEFPWDFRKNKIADNPSKRCGVELTTKLEGYMVWLTEELPHIEPAINLNCKIQIMNLKELTEEDKEKLKKHEIELSDENNKIV